MNQCADIHHYAMKSLQKKRNESDYKTVGFFDFIEIVIFLNEI